MRMNMTAAAVVALAALATPVQAADFSISFEWGNLKRCTSGSPNTVSNPQFKLGGVPAGTKTIRFKLVDLNVPGYAHGGGNVAYAGGSTIKPGAFRYQSPCPPDGRHTYKWTATALDAGGKKLGEASASRQYP